MRIALRLPLLLAIVSATASPGVQDRAQSADAEREKNVYSIYSLLLTNPQTSHGPDNNERYLIAAVTGISDPLTADCLAGPKDRQPDMREMLADYERRKGTQRQLKRAFSIRKAYLLISVEDAAAFQKERSPATGYQGKAAQDKRFDGVTDLSLFPMCISITVTHWHWCRFRPGAAASVDSVAGLSSRN